MEQETNFKIPDEALIQCKQIIKGGLRNQEKDLELGKEWKSLAVSGHWAKVALPSPGN